MLAWLLVAVPLGAGALLAGTGRRADRIAPALGVAVALLTLTLAIAAAFRRPVATAPFLAGIDIRLAVDGFSAILVLTVSVVTLAVLLFASGEFGSEQARARFTGLMLLFAGAMLVTVTATGLLPLLMGWEVMGATSWALIAFWWRDPRRVRAANMAFVTTRGADLGLYLAAGAAVAGGVGSLALAELPAATEPWLTLLTGGIVLAAIGKSAQLPLSFWLSGAMEGPSPVSALLHSATMVAAGAYLLLRVAPLLAVSGWAPSLVAWVGAGTAVVLGLVAVAQTDLKQLLAASTCAQVGFMVLAAGVGGVVAGTSHLVAHAATKSALFLTAGAWLTALGTKALPGLRGGARRHPLVGVTFTVAAASLAGLAPLSLWVTKDQVLATALARSPALYVTGLVGAVIATVYSVKAVWFVWQPEQAGGQRAWDTEQPGTREVSAPARVVLPALAGCAAVLGVLGLPAVMRGIGQLVGAPVAAVPAAWELTVSAVLALAAAAGAWWWGGRFEARSRGASPGGVVVPGAGRRALGDWLRLERAAYVLAVRPTMALARGLAAVDDRVLHRAVLAVPVEVRRLARLTERRGEVRVAGVVQAIVAGARRLGRLARRPQTGQLHHYYAQAAVALLVLALLTMLVR